MHLIIGGRYMGKLQYARSIYGQDAAVCDLAQEEPEAIFSAQIAVNLQDCVKKLLRRGESPTEFFKGHIGALQDKVLIGDETGSGIIPTDPFERQWRDNTGLVYQYLAAQAQMVDRVWAGLPTRLKNAIVQATDRGPEVQDSVSVIRAAAQSSVAWTGGTTRQLAIYPPDSEYQQRNFLWRLSSATVELEESQFTALPGVDRIIMVLAGRVHLTHEGIRNVVLGPFEQDSFKGEWTTHSKGMCVDFNLMTRGCSGKLEALSAGPAVVFGLTEAALEAWEAIYCLAPELEVTIKYQSERLCYKLNRHDMLLLHKTADLYQETKLLLHGADVCAIRASIAIVGPEPARKDQQGVSPA